MEIERRGARSSVVWIVQHQITATSVVRHAPRLPPPAPPLPPPLLLHLPPPPPLPQQRQHPSTFHVQPVTSSLSVQQCQHQTAITTRTSAAVPALTMTPALMVN